jgi:ribosomal protein S18 acetylase RimI-like enzyme
MYRLSELNRLQQNFPYDDSRHRMLVAVMKDPAPTSSRTNLDGSTRRASPSPQQERIVAFCDFDARPATRWQDPPRPYLSDLAVDAGFRRRGIARALIELCERMVVETLNQSSLYMRVERDNSNAMTMYQKLLYQPQAHTIFGVKDTTVLLCKPLVVTPSTVTSTCSVTN